MLEEKFDFKEFVRFVLSEPLNLLILFLLVVGLISSTLGVYHYGRPEVKSEIQLELCIKKVASGNKFVVRQITPTYRGESLKEA